MSHESRRRASTELRQDLVDRLVASGAVRSGPVEAAMRAVPRELFTPDLDVLDVYEDRAQLLKADSTRTLSTISQPTMVAIMLELAGLSPGDRVLEIGTGSGYNAALLATLVGPAGSVVSIDIEADLVDAARVAIESLELTNVSVHQGDGREGWPDGAPYDCVMSTVGVEEVPEAWRAQVADGGRLLVPLLDERRMQVEVRTDGAFDVVASSPAVFIPLR